MSCIPLRSAYAENMKKVAAGMLVLSYVAFAPLCFANSLGNIHSDKVYTAHTTHMHNDQVPLAVISEHAQMYTSMTSANPVN
jgi:hypothetical protein